MATLVGWQVRAASSRILNGSEENCTNIHVSSVPCRFGVETWCKKGTWKTFKLSTYILKETKVEWHQITAKKKTKQPENVLTNESDKIPYWYFPFDMVNTGCH